MPISTIMLVTVSSAWTRCETGASTPMVAATLVPASSTGRPAAISAPNASSISTSVTGRLIVSADGQVVGDPLVDGGVEADVPGLAHLERREVGLHRLGDRLERRDVVLVAGELDGDEVRRAVRAGLRLGHLVDGPEPRHAGHDRGGGLGGGRLVELAVGGRDQDLLGVGLVEAGAVDERVGAAGVAEPVVGVGGRLGRDHGREADREGDERDPAEDRPPRVQGAPAGRAVREG